MHFSQSICEGISCCCAADSRSLLCSTCRVEKQRDAVMLATHCFGLTHRRADARPPPLPLPPPHSIASMLAAQAHVSRSAAPSSVCQLLSSLPLPARPRVRREQLANRTERCRQLSPPLVMRTASRSYTMLIETRCATVSGSYKVSRKGTSASRGSIGNPSRWMKTRVRFAHNKLCDVVVIPSCLSDSLPSVFASPDVFKNLENIKHEAARVPSHV